MSIKAKREICMKEFESQREAVTVRCESDIEKYRKGDCQIILKDKHGKPCFNKSIYITQKYHDFKYGANLFMLDEFETEQENKAFRDNFKKYFNLGTVPFYWDALEPQQNRPRYDKDSPKIYRRPATDLCVEFCKESGILPKAHCLFYDKFTPDWLPKDNEVAMRRLYEKHFAEIAERYKGKMYEFEVTNETIISKEFPQKTVLSDTRNIIEWCFDLARKYFGDDVLVINEGNPLPSINENGYTAPYFLQLEKLLAKGTSIDKIGIQNHIFGGTRLPAGEFPDEKEVSALANDYMNPQKYFNSLDRLCEFGLPLEMTEVTVSTFGEGDEAEILQADILEQLYTIWFSIPNMESIVYWNSVDYTAYQQEGSDWNENNCRGGLFHRDLTPKKSAERLYYLFNKKWHTEKALKTDTLGQTSFRGFYGDYTAEIDGKVYKFSVNKDSNNKVEIII